MDLSTYHQINGLLDPSLILIEKLARVMLLAGSFFASQHGCPAVLDEVYVANISFFGSKATPFFHTANVVAEIFRARVIVAISGFIPRATKPA